MALCEFCQKIKPPHKPKRNEKTAARNGGHYCFTRHQPTFNSLIQSANDGCELCLLFLPFVKAHAKNDDDSDASSDGSGYSLDDPFEDLDPPEETQYEIEKGVYYTDDGLEYLITYETGEQGVWEEYEARIERERKIDGGDRNDNVHKSHRNEILQWLMPSATMSFGPQQIWVIVSNNNDHNTFMEGAQTPNNGLVTIHAGSVSPESIHMGSTEEFLIDSYCLDGEYIRNKADLVIKCPLMWTIRGRSLDMKSNGREKWLRPNFEFFQRIDNIFDVEPRGMTRDVDSDPLSMKSISRIRHWMSECEKTHPACKLQYNNIFPTRLIDTDLRGLGGSSERVRLQETVASRYQSGALQYATLSHCWGRDTSKVSQLLKDNLTEMLEGIDLSRLSQNFKDAIIIARCLNIRYVWIDALCIIQDCPTDWAKESSKLADYYRQARITISAFASPSASHGILKSRTHDAVSVGMHVDGQPIFIRRVLEDVLTVMRSEEQHDTHIRQLIEAAPLNQRAWALQERLLSRKIIHYTEQQLVWQCKTCVYSEDNQYTVAKHQRSRAHVNDLIRLSANPQTATGGRKEPSRKEIDDSGWWRLLRGYTSRLLTYDSDKLPGVSSIAREIQELTGATYMAGLWGGSHEIFIENLLWSFVARRLRASKQRPAKIANGSPSWSWSSTRGEIEFRLNETINNKPGIDPVFGRSLVPLATSNPFGQVEYGRIDVKGWTHTYTGSSAFDDMFPHKKRLLETRERLRLAGLTSEIEKHAEPKNSKKKASSEGISNDKMCKNPPDDDDFSDHDDASSCTSEYFEDAEIDPFGELDIPEPDYDWISTPHIILYLATMNESDHELDRFDESNGAGQVFLILKLVGLSSALGEPIETETGPAPTYTDPDWLHPLGTYERVGLAYTDDLFKPLEITEADGWRKQELVLV